MTSEKLEKKLFYCVHKNLKSRIEEHNWWQKEKENNNNKQKKEKEQKVKDYFQTDISKLAYGSRDTVNQAAYYAPKPNELNTITEWRIDQLKTLNAFYQKLSIAESRIYNT